MRAGERFDAAFLLALARKTGRLFKMCIRDRVLPARADCLRGLSLQKEAQSSCIDGENVIK